MLWEAGEHCLKMWRVLSFSQEEQPLNNNPESVAACVAPCWTVMLQPSEPSCGTRVGDSLSANNPPPPLQSLDSEVAQYAENTGPPSLSIRIQFESLITWFLKCNLLMLEADTYESPPLSLTPNRGARW